MSPPASSVKHWVLILGGCRNVRRWGKTLRTCFRRWDVSPSPCLFPVHHEENPSSFLFTMKRTRKLPVHHEENPASFLFTAKRTLNAPINYNDAVFPGALNEQNQEQWSKTPFIPDIDLSGIAITQRESLTNILPYTSFPAPSLGFSIGSNEPFQLSSLSFTLYHFLPSSYLSTVPVFHSPPPPLFLIIF